MSLNGGGILIKNLLLVAAILGIGWVQAASAAVVAFENAGGGDFRIDSITDLQIGVTTYDVDFVHGGSYEDLVAAVGSPITFTTLSAASDAAGFLASAVNALGVDGSAFTSLPGDIRVPWRVRSGVIIDFAKSGRFSVNPIGMSTNPSGATTSTASASVSSGSTTTEWAVFTVVPEPATVTLLGGVGALAVLRRRSL